MEFGNKPSDGGHLLLRSDEIASLGLNDAQRNKFLRRIYGAQDFITVARGFAFGSRIRISRKV